VTINVRTPPSTRSSTSSPPDRLESSSTRRTSLKTTGSTSCAWRREGPCGARRLVAKAELAREREPDAHHASAPRLTFNFRDADIKVVIDMIARVSGANIIVPAE
jgi:hypothetical protein